MKPGRQRLDKWLWFARFARTRTLAARLVTDGYVRVNGQRAASAATAVGLGDVVTVAAEASSVQVPLAIAAGLAALLAVRLSVATSRGQTRA